MAKVWRLKVGFTTGGGGWGDWSYYEDESKFLEALLDAAISEAAEKQPNNTNRLAWVACRWWRDRVQRKEGERARIDRVVAADVLADGEWVPVPYKLVPPHLEVEL